MHGTHTSSVKLTIFTVVLAVFALFVVSVRAANYDLSGDGVIGWTDLEMFCDQWLGGPCVAADWCQGTDFDQSGQVDTADYTLLARYWLVVLPVAPKASNPIPGNGKEARGGNLILRWKPGDSVQQTNGHIVYLGTSFSDVSTATTASAAYKGICDVNNYTPTGLVGNTTYYWRIDEVNTSMPDSPWKGDVWSFTFKTTKLLYCFLLAGQSNATGCGDSASIPAPYNAIQNGVKIYITGQSAWAPGWNSLQPNMGAAWGAFGPEVSFGYDMDHAISDANIAIIKTAYTDTALYDRWKARSGDMYNLLVNTVHTALAALDPTKYEPRICGMIWMQGESDTFTSTRANAYKANLKQFIDCLRADLPAPNMPFIIAQIANHYPFPYYTTVANAQQNVGDTYPYCKWFVTNDLTTIPGNDGHYDAQGQIALGQRFAQKMLIYFIVP